MKLPYVCPDHPDAQIRHEWLRTEGSITMNGERRVIERHDHDHIYKCAVCGRELAAEKEKP